MLSLPSLRADSKKSAEDQHVELIRGLTAEWATVKAYLPRSKKPLDFDSSGAWDKDKWQEIGRELGPTGKIGDLIQITHVSIEKDAIVLELNHGTKGSGHWYDHVQAGIGGATQPINSGQTSTVDTGIAVAGTNIAVRFSKGIGDVTTADVKKMLKPVLDFDKQTVTENYVDTLPPEIKKAVQDKKAIEGMDRDQVLLALGRPVRKSRETKDGQEIEDWIYGEPPGRITFVTFTAGKVIHVKETYAGLGGSIAGSTAQK
ncbi:MAG: hypothetical protein JO307_32330 [Bryobacterales bacterium]|nr:hypothetical protein [Bryobacterales bacterium]MBV9400331.1 hypothetical protein [Bryobacterales bacterium]